MASHNRTGPLSDIRVLDLAGTCGVFCGKLLADMGADVIRVEPPQGNPSRRTPPFYKDVVGLERSLFDWHFNTSKRSITLDITTADGQVLLKELTKQADILIETFAPGYLESLALGAPDLHLLNPGLIVVSITPFGQTGPYRDYLGDELIAQASGGLLRLCGWPDRPPVMMAGLPAMHQASAEGASGALLALLNRKLTGRGDHVDVSLQACMPLTLMIMMPHYFVLGEQRPPTREGDGHNTPMNGLFRCRDGYVDVRFRNRPGQWDRLVQWMDAAGMAKDLTDSKWREPAVRLDPANAAHIDEVFQTFLVRLSKETILETAQRGGTEVGAAYTTQDLLADPQLQARQFFVKLEHEDFGQKFTYPGAPYRLSATPWSLYRRAPHLGEHNQEVFTNLLGLAEADLVNLAANGVI